jgi:K+:H+ antiporter
MQRIGQPAVMGQMIAGILLGPSVFGAIWPEAQRAVFAADPQQKSMIDGISQLGILMLLLLTGMETDLRLVKKARRAAISASAAGIVLPFACGFVLGELLHVEMQPKPDQRIVTLLFLGTALSIASVKIVATVVREMGFIRRNVGMTLIASAIIDDTVGWVIVSITLGLAVRGRVDTVALGQSMLATAIVLVASFTLGRRLVFSIIRWTNDSFVSEVPVVTAILIIMGAMALTTHLIGVHTVLGAFVAGILVGESPILTSHIDEQLRGLVVALFMPIFFALAGLHADLTHLRDPTLFFLTIGLILIASLGKFAGAFVGGELGGLSLREFLALGCGMNARGSTEVIIASIGLSTGALSQDLFTMIVAMAVVTTMAMPPTLRWAFSRLPLRRDERDRIEREAFDATGFVTNIERLLFAADVRANGDLARLLAGMLAQSRGIPMTILYLGRGESVQVGPNRKSRTGETKARDTRARRLDVALHVESLAPEAAVSKEARKGYDLLMIGVERTTAAHGDFHEQIGRMAESSRARSQSPWRAARICRNRRAAA